MTEEASLLAQRREALLNALPQRDLCAFTPEPDQVAEVEAVLGLKLNQAPRPKASPSQDEDTLLAERAARLLADLIASGALETTRGFPLQTVALSVAAAWRRPARVLALLEDREDVVELFLSEEELVEAMARVR